MTATTFALQIVRASLEGAALALTVGAIVRFVPRLPATARCMLWWFVSLKLLLGFVGLPALPLSLPSLDRAPAIVQRAGQVATPVAQALAPAARGDAAGTPPVATGLDMIHMAALAFLVLWIAGVMAAIVFHVRDARRLSRLWQRSSPVESADVRNWLAGWIGADHGRRVELRASAEIGAPLIFGSSRIVVPSACLDSDRASLRMALAHEVSHVRRGDLGWGLVPALAQCAFWFHPLAHWCAREYALAREEACDAEALRLSDATPHRYGELLVAFGVDKSRGFVTAASCGSAHVHQLTRRLHMLKHASRSSSVQRLAAASALTAIGLLAIVPVRFVASAAALDSDDNTKSRTHTSSSTHTGTKSHTKSTKSTSSGYSYSTDDDGWFSYGYSNGDGQTMSGSWSSDDQEWLEKLKHRAKGDYGWFRLDGKTYMVHAKEDIDRFKEIMRPESELGQQQGKLGDQQSRLGDQQSALGNQQSKLGDQQSDLSSEMRDLQEELNDAAREGKDRPDLERKLDGIRARMESLSERQSALGEQQAKLGEQQSALGEKQSELGRRQHEASRLSRQKVRELAPEMIRSGRAVLIDG